MTRRKNNNVSNRKGSTTVYICVVAMSVILIAAVFADAAKYFYTYSYFKKTCDICSESLMTVYSSRLKEQFGIYALSQNYFKNLDDEFVKLFNANITDDIEYISTASKNNSEDSTVFDNRKALKTDILKVRINPVLNIGDPGIFEYQIKDYMKMRLPAGLLEDTAKHLNILSKIAGYSSFFSQKIQIEKYLSDIESHNDELQKLIEIKNGYGLGINNFKYDSALKSSIYEFLDKCEYYVYDLYGKDHEINDCPKPDELNNIYDTIVVEKIQSYLNLHNKAIEIVDRIEKSISKVKNMAEQIEGDIDESKSNENSLEIDQLNTAVKEDIHYYKTISNNTMCEKFKTNLVNNMRILGVMQNNLYIIKNIVCSNHDLSNKNSIYEQIDGIKKYLPELFNLYSLIEDSIIDTNYRKILQDNKQRIEEAKRLVKDEGFDASYFLNEFNEIKNNSNSFFKSIVELDSKEVRDLIYDFSFENINKDNNMNQMSEGKKITISDIFNKMCSKIKLIDINSIHENFIIGEYILGTFKNAATSKYTKEHAEFDWNCVKKDLRITAYKNQTEKIISEMPTDASSLIYCASEIVLIRFIINTLQIYSQPQKRDLAYAAASAIAGWWSMGTAVPLAATMIICSWGLSEAINDVKKLLDGKYIALFKSDEDWSVDVLKKIVKSMPTENTFQNKFRIMLNYRDYLRFLLYFLNYDDKKIRVLKMIEIDVNTTEKDFAIKSCYTGMKIQIEAENHAIFITGHLLKKILPDIKYPFSMRYENEIRYK